MGRAKPHAKRSVWLAYELEFLRSQYDKLPTYAIAKALDRTVTSVQGKAGVLGLKKPPELIAQLAREAMLQPSHPARRTQFAKGIRPWNTGVKGVVGTHEACKAHQFKPGRPPEAAHNYKPMLVPARRWTPVYRLVWEAAHGPIPKGHRVDFKPGMRTADPSLITADKLECIDRVEHLRRHTFHQYGPEVAAVVHLRGAITRQINKRARNEQDPQ